MYKSLLVISNYRPDKQWSMSTFSTTIISGLEREFDVKEIYPPYVFGRIPFAKKWFSYVDKFIVFIPIILFYSFLYKNIFITDHSNAIYHLILKNKYFITTVHDLMGIRSALERDFGRKVSVLGKVLQRFVFKGLKKTDLLICDSLNTKNDLDRFIPLSSKKIIPLSLLQSFPSRKTDSMIKKKIVFHVSNNNWYKCRLDVLKVFKSLRELDPHFILKMAGAPFTKKMKNYQKKHDLDITFVGHLDSCSLSKIYQKSHTLIYPSIYEGYGLPVLEALYHKTHVLIRNRPAINEFNSDYLTIEDDIDKWPQRIISFEYDNKHEEEKINKLCSPKRMQSEYIKLFKEHLL